jgi:TILa domain
LPKELRPSQPPIEVLHSAPINSSAVEFFVRLPQTAATKPFEAQYSFSSKGPWSPIGVSKKMVAWDESTFVIQVAGLKSTELYLRVAQGELRTKGVKVDLSSAEQSSGTMRKLLSAEPEEADDTDKGMERLLRFVASSNFLWRAAAVPCMYEGKAFNPGEAYLSINCTERCECDGKGAFKCSPTSPETSAACSKTTGIGGT